jgi:rsbT co-antagonist protein RsbR
MTTLSRNVRQLMQTHPDSLLADWRRRLGDEAGTDGGELQAEMQDLLQALGQVLQQDPAPAGAEGGPALKALDTWLAAASQERAVRGLPPEGSVRFLHAGRDALLALAQQHLGGDPGRSEAAQSLVRSLFDRCVTTLVAQFVAARENVIRAQAQSLLDMSTPVIVLWDAILLLPLVGVVDSLRAVQVAERLLEAIGRTEAEVTLIDVTGVPVMDTSVARHLLRTVAAAEMLGTRVILTGISPTTAQTMVKLGIDMASVPTRGTLRAGVALAFKLTGRDVTRVQGG